MAANIRRPVQTYSAPSHALAIFGGRPLLTDYWPHYRCPESPVLYSQSTASLRIESFLAFESGVGPNNRDGNRADMSRKEPTDADLWFDDKSRTHSSLLLNSDLTSGWIHWKPNSF